VLISLGLRGFEDSTWPGYNASRWQTHLELLQDARVSAVHLVGWTKERPPAVTAQIAEFLLAHAVRQYEARIGQTARPFSAEACMVCLREARAVLATESRAPARSNGRSLRRIASSLPASPAARNPLAGTVDEHSDADLCVSWPACFGAPARNATHPPVPHVLTAEEGRAVIQQVLRMHRRPSIQASGHWVAIVPEGVVKCEQLVARRARARRASVERCSIRAENETWAVNSIRTELVALRRLQGLAFATSLIAFSDSPLCILTEHAGAPLTARNLVTQHGAIRSRKPPTG